MASSSNRAEEDKSFKSGEDKSVNNCLSERAHGSPDKSWASSGKNSSGGWQARSSYSADMRGGCGGGQGYVGMKGWVNSASRSSGQQQSGWQDENPINWDGLVEDVFKKEIGKMAEDMRK